MMPVSARYDPGEPLATICLSLSLVVGLFFPTSIGGEISKEFGYVSAVILFCIYLGLIVSTRSLASPVLVISAIIINVSLLLATLLSELPELALGAYTFYFLLACLYIVDVHALRITRSLNQVLDVCSVLLLVLAVASVLGSVEVSSFFENNYSAFYPELVPAMFRLGKPVLMFGSHSLAGFFFYLFFLLNFLAYTRKKRLPHLILAVSFLCISLPLQSLTAYVYIIVGVVQLLCHFGVHPRRLLRLASIGIGLGLACLLTVNGEVRSLLWSAIRPLFTSNVNGLAARYTAIGTLAPDITYILEHPFNPVGVRYSKDLWFVDSGPVEYILRGSVVLLLAIYIGLFLFFRRNLRSLKDCLLLYSIYFTFEFGFSNLTYLRTLYLLPFVIAFFNSTAAKQSDSIAACHSPQAECVVT